MRKKFLINGKQLNKNLLALSLVLSFSSFHFQKSLGIIGLLVYPITVFIILLLVNRNLNKLLFLINKFNPKFIFSIFFLFLVIAYSLWYPYENIRSKGTDRDEALNQAVEEIISLHYPYNVRTYVEGRPHELRLDNNPITVLPGSILFAIPFVLLGNSSYQNFFWLIVLFVFLGNYYRSYSNSLLFIMSNLLLCGTFLFQILIGSDYIANSIWVLIFTIIVVKYSKVFNFKTVVFDILLGIGLASRFNFLIILVPLAFYFYLANDFRNTAKHTGIIIITFLIFTLPFMFYDFSNFTPIYYSNPFSQYNRIIPYSSIIFPVAATILLFFFSLHLKNNKQNVFQAISIGLLIPVLLIVTLDSVSLGKVTFAMSHYAFPSVLFFSFFVFDKLFFQKD